MRIFVLKDDEERGEWRKLHREALNELYCSLYSFRLITSRRMQWAVCIERMV